MYELFQQFTPFGQLMLALILATLSMYAVHSLFIAYDAFMRGVREREALRKRAEAAERDREWWKAFHSHWQYPDQPAQPETQPEEITKD
jgi:ABC-type Fe3+ transport system permease subunit